MDFESFSETSATSLKFEVPIDSLFADSVKNLWVQQLGGVC